MPNLSSPFLSNDHLLPLLQPNPVLLGLPRNHLRRSRTLEMGRKRKDEVGEGELSDEESKEDELKEGKESVDAS